MPNSSISKLNADEILLPEGLNIEPRHWDFIFTCFEPLMQVTGGIGTYHRLLIQQLSRHNVSILVLSAEDNTDIIFSENVVLINVLNITPRRPYNNVGGAHEIFSLHCHFTLRALSFNGHTFGVVEFSDYGADGFYSLRAASSGAYSFDLSIVRLHSPDLMLIEDNGGAHTSLSYFMRDRLERELSVFNDVDLVCYGGDAMMKRVSSLCSKFNLDISSKLVKCPHPYPLSLYAQLSDRVFPPETPQKRRLSHQLGLPRATAEGKWIALIGRIEYRKGQLQFFSKLLKDKTCCDFILNNNIHFLLVGKDVLEASGKYRTSDLINIIREAGLTEHVHFLGRMNQNQLWDVARFCHGFVFPSIFENYPNALIETLGFCRPIAISIHGCMPEICADFEGTYHFDPINFDASQLSNFWSSVLSDEPCDSFPLRIEAISRRISAINDFYLNLNETRRTRLALDPHSEPSIGFVIPAYNDTRFLLEAAQSCIKSMKDQDELIIVDDGSNPRAAAEIKRIAGIVGAKLVSLPENSGPAFARLAGVEALSTDVVQFCDADDLIEPRSISSVRHMFHSDSTLTMVCGAMSLFGEADNCWMPKTGSIWTAINENFAHAGSAFRRLELRSALLLMKDRFPINEDWVCNFLILAKGGIAKIVPEITYYYRRHPGTRSTFNHSEIFSVKDRMIALAWNNLDFSSDHLICRLRCMPPPANDYISSHELQLARRRPHKLLIDLLLFRILRVASRLSPPLPSKMAARFANSAAKRDPRR